MNEKKNGVFFLTGIYGVGKSTLAAKLSKKTNLNEYSASELIIKRNNEKYDQNKSVQNSINNQILLIEETNKLLEKNERIIISGHFCIFDKNLSVNILPTIFFDTVNIRQIILLKANTIRILANLKQRDNKNYTESTIKTLQDEEIKQATIVSLKKQIPFVIYDMLYNEEDVNNVIKLIHF